MTEPVLGENLEPKNESFDPDVTADLPVLDPEAEKLYKIKNREKEIKELEALEKEYWDLLKVAKRDYDEQNRFEEVMSIIKIIKERHEKEGEIK